MMIIDAMTEKTRSRDHDLHPHSVRPAGGGLGSVPFSVVNSDILKNPVQALQAAPLEQQLLLA